jgi:hypothetical protein
MFMSNTVGILHIVNYNQTYEYLCIQKTKLFTVRFLSTDHSFHRYIHKSEKIALFVFFLVNTSFYLNNIQKL